MEKLFYGVAPTNEHLNNASETIRQYLVDGVAGEVVKSLEIGIKIMEKQFITSTKLNEIIKKRFVFVDGEKKGKELKNQSELNQKNA